ncbi:MAG: BamA/TamA family outer membrane protein [Dysgonamonadaceae bacterium]|jgi:outer membrane protein assembly factor BamA|nr:BamA/TamA family outer membrane protein [Dysgonamonadaceae bacterium]
MKLRIGIVIIYGVFLMACSTTKRIPDGYYLLDQVKMEMTDKGADETVLLPYIQQQPNRSKLGIIIYQSVSNDSNWLKKTIRKMGEAPVIYNRSLMHLSVDELTMQLQNMGYLHAQVNALTDSVGKKMMVTYKITNNEPYRIRRYGIDIPELKRRRTNNNRLLANRSRVPKPSLKTGNLFDMNLLEQERIRNNTRLRNQGYYASTLDNLHYLADTTLRSNQVDLSLILLDSSLMIPYTVEKIKVLSGYDPIDKGNYKVSDSIDYKGITIYYDSLHFLRPSVIASKILVRPNDLFRERRGQSTVDLFRAMNCVGRADLQYTAGNYPDSTLLDCTIYLTPGNIHSLQLAVEGTNKAGDLGVALDVTYGHLNLFNGSETFNLNMRGAYEFVGFNSDNSELDHSYYEWRLKPSLMFPTVHLPYLGALLHQNFNTQTQYSLGYDLQRRPEYIRNFFNFNWKIRWTGRKHNVVNSLSLLDVNYVNMPWVSAGFQDYLDNKVDSLTKYSYANVFTAGMNYSIIFTNANNGLLRQLLYTIRFGAETSGNALHALASAIHASQNADGQYSVMGNPFAQYAKGDLDLAYTFRLDTRSSVAFHWGGGVAYPYRNSTILPFEKRYYAGGPNSVRGWSTRYLGPGSFNRGQDGDPTTHVGDISLIGSAEYRYRWLSWFEPAVFVDAGNIWTIRDYPNQPGGYFQWNTFYKEIAIGAGAGLRFDWSFLILRFDFGWKVRDPAQEESERWVLLKNRFWKDTRFYVAIGYPF